MAKAFGAGKFKKEDLIIKKNIILGADFVMLGGMLAGHDESGSGEIIERNGRKYKLFYGMSSKTAMDKHVRKLNSINFFIEYIVL